MRAVLLHLFCMAFLLSFAAHAQDAAPAGGALDIATDSPGADVMVDGARAGVTPLHLEGLTPGDHDVLISRPGSLPWQRMVSIRAGTAVLLDVTLPAAAAPSTAAPTGNQGPAARDAWKDFGASILALPWAGLAVGASFAFLLASVVFFTSSPRDIPVIAESAIQVPGPVWTGAGVTALALGLGVGAIALVLLALNLAPFTRLIAAIEASNNSKSGH